ncbi:outer membrane protein assembly factor BamD [Moraxella porci]|uniref:outer membrane protein assembly factor BamD n=1 Tax=Moraxella porci TaxID=1288392 RepID=UPI00244BCBBF|nr:outer membrane protein assembly factor BamD [Moraxella porci]MDH2272533.1 outer membrane protein assembly factor BamD [Moraxella porci]
MKANALKIAVIAVLSGSLMTGCATVGGLFDRKAETIETAEKSDAAYYQEAVEALNKNQNRTAIESLNNIRTFYPTGQYAQQALLDLIYAQYQANDFEAVLKSTEEFIRSYPNSRSVDYALYVQGVTNMGGAPKASRLFRLDQSSRDVTYLRLAFQDFQTLLNNYPNSAYAADAAQRMVAIYNDFAENEMVAARWYIKRDAMVAAANRAKWVFQYYPQSTAVPEAIAILAHANNELGLTDTANQYKTLLQINYPQYLNRDGSVRLNDTGAKTRTQKVLSAISFGRLGRASDNQDSYQGQYNGATREQIIRQAGGIVLPAVDSQALEAPAASTTRRPAISLGLPDSEAEAGHLNDVPR